MSNGRPLVAMQSLDNTQDVAVCRNCLGFVGDLILQVSRHYHQGPCGSGARRFCIVFPKVFGCSDVSEFSRPSFCRHFPEHAVQQSDVLEVE